MAYVIEIRGITNEGLGRTTRLWIKSSMEQFGEVAQVRKPPTSGIPTDDVAFVHFVREDAAFKAVDFLKTGAELNDGTPVKGDWKSGGGGGGGHRGGSKGPGKGGRSWMDKDAPVDSRSLAMGRERQKSRSRERQKHRSRSRSRRGRRSPSRRDRGRRKSRSRSKSRKKSRSRSRSRKRSRSRRRRGDSRDRGRGEGRHGGSENNSVVPTSVSVPPPASVSSTAIVPIAAEPIEIPQSRSSYSAEVEEALRQARLAMHGVIQIDQSEIDRYQS